MSEDKQRCYMFAGPTLLSVPSELIGDHCIEICPPARRGDIARLVERHGPAHIALVDGTFHSYPSVGHAEILNALRCGWKVVGLCSMGAIRACEMRTLGMRGFGRIYRQFVEDEEFADDEVALLHSSDPPYAPISEPLVHIRAFIRHLVDQNLLGQGNGARVISTMKERWYGYRTLAKLRTLLVSEMNQVDSASLAREIASFDRFQLKTHDLVEFIAKRAWVN